MDVAEEVRLVELVEDLLCLSWVRTFGALDRVRALAIYTSYSHPRSTTNGYKGEKGGG